MEPAELAKKLDRITLLLTMTLTVIALAAVSLVAGLLPKLERVAAATERVEKRFNTFADSAQPVMSAGAGKAIESLQNLDAERLSKSATDASDALINAAAERAKQFLEGKQKGGDEK